MKKSKLVAPMADEHKLFVPQTALSLRQQRALVQFAAAMCFHTWREAYDKGQAEQDYEGFALHDVCEVIDRQLDTFPPEVKRLYMVHQQEYMDGKELNPVN